jgi:GNAT superfamily N-acetyltransferase
VNGSSEIDHAIEVFVRGFGFVRSRTHPYVVDRIEQAWVLRDAPRRDPRRYRREEWVAHGVEPAALAGLAARHARGRYVLSVVRTLDEDPKPIRQAYNGLGFRLGGTEPFLRHALTDIPADPADSSTVAVEQISTPEQAKQLRASNGPKIAPEALQPDGRVRQYAAFEDGVPVGWVASIGVRDGAGVESTWCSDLFVVPEQRRRGIGRILMLRLLRDDRDRGVRWSVLSASSAGAQLYPRLGYEPIGELLMYTPIRQV